jgi:hypothetical protein
VLFAGGPAFAPGAALSPDGKYIVFMGTRAGATTPTLFVRPIDSFDARPIPGTEEAGFPFWSPDSASIGFFAQGKLKRIALAGGSAQTLCDAKNGEGAAWSPGGVIVFAPDGAGPLSRVSASGGRAEAATTLSAADKESSHRWPAFLPDGRHFLLLSQPGNVIRVGSLDSPESKRLLSAESRAEYASGYLLFARSETLFAQPFDVRKLETTAEALPIVEGIRTNALNGRRRSRCRRRAIWRTARAPGRRRSS